jgi:hypothetical protein
VHLRIRLWSPGMYERGPSLTQTERTHMPLYFFNVEDDRTIIDQEGTELLNLEAAREEAVSTSAELLRCRAGIRFGTESPGGCGLRTKRAGREQRYSGSSFPRSLQDDVVAVARLVRECRADRQPKVVLAFGTLDQPLRATSPRALDRFAHLQARGIATGESPVLWP